MIVVAASKYTMWPPRTVSYTEYKKAAPVPSAINVFMLALRWRNPLQAAR